MNFDDLKKEWEKSIEPANGNADFNLDLKHLDDDLRSMEKKVNNRDLWILFQALSAIPFIIYFAITHSSKSVQELTVIFSFLLVCLLSPCYYWSARKSGMKNLANIRSFLQSKKIKLSKQIKITKYSLLSSICGLLFIALCIVDVALLNNYQLPFLILVEVVGYWWYLKEMKIYSKCKFLLKQVNTQLDDMEMQKIYD